MQWTTELVKAEMDYRLESARDVARLEQVRAARKAHQSFLRRLFHHG